MTLFRSLVRPNMIKGIRCYDPVFKPTVKEMPKHESIVFNLTASNVYKELLTTVDTPPRMHSFLIPKFKQIRRWQAEVTLDTGEPSYKRFPVGRAFYKEE